MFNACCQERFGLHVVARRLVEGGQVIQAAGVVRVLLAERFLADFQPWRYNGSALA